MPKSSNGERKYHCRHEAQQIQRRGKIQKNGSKVLFLKQCQGFFHESNRCEHELLAHPFCTERCQKCKKSRREDQKGGDDEHMEVEEKEEEDEELLCRHKEGNKFCHFKRYKKSTLAKHEERHFFRGVCQGECHVCEDLSRKRVVRSGKERKRTIRENLLKLGEKLGVPETEDIIAEILSTIPLETSFDGILKGSEKKKLLEKRLKGFFRQGKRMREESKERRKQEKKEMLAEIVPVYIDIGMTNADVRKIEKVLHFGPTLAQYRWWKDKLAASFALSKSPGGRGYIWDLEDAIRSLYCNEDMNNFSLENGNCLPLFLSVDGGSVDGSNSAVFVKLTRCDSSWIIGNRHKIPSLAATIAVLYMKEDGKKISEELGEIFSKLNYLPVILPNEDTSRKVSLTHSNDAKMSCILFGSPNAYCTRSGRPCFRCTATKGTASWGKFSSHHFVACESDWSTFAKLDPEEDPFSITSTNSKNVGWWSLSERFENWEKIKLAQASEERKEKGAKKKRLALERETQQLFAPITCEEPVAHNLEIIHLIEGVMKRVCKLTIMECPSGSPWEKKVIGKFKELTGLKFERQSNELPWKRISAARLNRVHWLRLLRGFVKNSDESGKQEAFLSKYFILEFDINTQESRLQSFKVASMIGYNLDLAFF